MIQTYTFRFLIVLVVFCLNLVLLVNGFERHLNKRSSINARSGLNITAPSECRNLKGTVDKTSINITWSPPWYTNGSLGGYEVEYKLKDGKNWSIPKKDTLGNYTLSYSVKKNQTTNGWYFELRAFNTIPYNGTRLYSQPVVFKSGTAGLFGFTILPNILGVVILFFVNKQ